MKISSEKLVSLRNERGWSQEKLAIMSGVSERTIQRVEKDGTCSLDTKVAFATTFEVPLSELSAELIEATENKAQMKTNWSGVFGLFLLGLTTPLLMLITADTNHREWEVASCLLVLSLTIVLTAMNYGIKPTYKFLDNTSWIIKTPAHVQNLNKYIIQSKTTIEYAYIIGIISTVAAGLSIAVHAPAKLEEPIKYFTLIIRPFFYSILFSELWFRPYKKKMESMLLEQQEHTKRKLNTTKKPLSN